MLQQWSRVKTAGRCPKHPTMSWFGTISLKSHLWDIDDMRICCVCVPNSNIAVCARVTCILQQRNMSLLPPNFVDFAYHISIRCPHQVSSCILIRVATLTMVSRSTLTDLVRCFESPNKRLFTSFVIHHVSFSTWVDSLLRPFSALMILCSPHTLVETEFCKPTDPLCPVLQSVFGGLGRWIQGFLGPLVLGTAHATMEKLCVLHHVAWSMFDRNTNSIRISSQNNSPIFALISPELI